MAATCVGSAWMEDPTEYQLNVAHSVSNCFNRNSPLAEMGRPAHSK